MLLKWQENQWLHKENFVCSFTQPQLLRYYRAQYWEEDTDISASPEEDDNVVKENHKLPVVSTIYLELYDRCSQQRVFGPICLDTIEGREALGSFVTSLLSQQRVQPQQPSSSQTEENMI
jgi:hypothetical protein